MGGKHNSSGRDDRSDEYEDRRPPASEREDAQATVREAIERAEQSSGPTAGANVNRENVEASLGVDLSKTESANASSRPYTRLSEVQRETMRQTLIERYGDDAVTQVYSQLTNWKGSSQPREQTQLHEKIAKKALGIDAPIRSDADGEIMADDPPQEAVELYQELSAASSAFVGEHYGDQFSVYRAVRNKAVGDLTAQAIDNPNTDEYSFTTSVLSNYTTEKAVARQFESGIIVEGSATSEQVAMATDQVKPHDSTIDEAELHLRGGLHSVASDDVRHVGRNTGKERAINKTISTMESPDELNISEHKDVAELIDSMHRSDSSVRTDEGADRIARWFSAYRSHPDSDSRDVEVVKVAVDNVIASRKSDER